ncbi:hypothetical protein V7O61_03305 [Methanolobus sp. WCC1]|uniref:hypothetical protein n=1 Tax=unclassified Methanolobus TaxID=2629569 RepID=UPI0032516954
MKIYKEGTKIVSILMTMFIVTMFAVAPALACEPGTPCSETSKVSEPVELLGTEKQKVIDQALENEMYIKLNQDLINEGYKQKSIDTYSVTIEEDSTVVKIATFEFESADGNTDGLTYAYNEQTGESIVVRGGNGCPTCLALIVAGGFGCTAVCVTGGVLTMGAACVVCLAAVATYSLCDCYVCGCSMGYETSCDMADQYNC